MLEVDHIIHSLSLELGLMGGHIIHVIYDLWMGRVALYYQKKFEMNPISLHSGAPFVNENQYALLHE